jgi:hypothetical protein
VNLRLDHAALASMVAQSGIVQRVAREMRDEARLNAAPITSKTDAIAVEGGIDAISVYADVGYLRRHPGFFLWWHEVGTRRHPPTPHLRPTVRPRL